MRLSETLDEPRAVNLREPGVSDDQFRPDHPQFKQYARTGSTRFMPTLRGDKFGRVFTYWFDHISFQEYDEMRTDGQCRAGLALLKLPIQRARYTINCESTEISAFCQEMLKPIWPSFLRQCLLALDFGYAVFEEMFGLEYNKRVTETQGQAGGAQVRTYPYAITLKRMMHMDPLTLWLLAYRRSGQYAGFKQYTPYDVSVPENKSFLFSNDIEFQEIYGVSRLKPCYPYWWYQKLMFEYTNLYYELYGNPQKKVMYPPGNTQINGVQFDNQDLAIEMGEAMQNDSVITIPSTPYGMVEGKGAMQWDVNYLEAQRSGADHISYFKYLDYKILKALLVPQLAIETGEGGTYNLGQEQIDFFLMSEEALGDQIAEAINSQVLKRIVKYNFGVKAPQAILSFEPMTRDVRQGMTQILIDSLGQGQGIPMADGQAMVPDWQYMAERVGMPVKYLSGDDLEMYQQAKDTINPPPPAPVIQGGQGDMPFDGGPDNPGEAPKGKNTPTSSTPPEGEKTDMQEPAGFRWALSEGELVAVAL